MEEVCSILCSSFGTKLNLGTSGIIEVGSVYYWVGEDHTNGGAFQAINCYSSTVSRHYFDLTVYL
jgi:hypothetical protein